MIIIIIIVIVYTWVTRGWSANCFQIGSWWALNWFEKKKKINVWLWIELHSFYVYLDTISLKSLFNLPIKSFSGCGKSITFKNSAKLIVSTPALISLISK